MITQTSWWACQETSWTKRDVLLCPHFLQVPGSPLAPTCLALVCQLNSSSNDFGVEDRICSQHQMLPDSIKHTVMEYNCTVFTSVSTSQLLSRHASSYVCSSEFVSMLLSSKFFTKLQLRTWQEFGIKVIVL